MTRARHILAAASTAFLLLAFGVVVNVVIEAWRSSP